MGKTVADGRKAIVSLDAVREAFASYASVREEIGLPTTGHTFDRGARGKGYAQYNSADMIVRTFDTKEDALTFYSRYSEVAREILSAPLVSLSQPAESDAEAPKVPAQRGRKAKDAAAV